MLARLDLADAPAGGSWKHRLPRAKLDVGEASDLVRPVVDDVRARGDIAVREATLRFDGVDVPVSRVSAEALGTALADLDPAVHEALVEAIARTRLVSARSRPADVVVQVVPGGTVTERFVPVERVGLYVPGGRVAYPSSVVMNVVPAQEAGVGSLVVVSPPQADGLPHPVVLAACALLGVEEVYAVGGAQAIALLAYGSETCAPVDVVTGPGNVYVAAAKRLVRGVVGIDSEAGPTEIAILADGGANARHVAADLISQAEHDPLAACLLVTDSPVLVDAVEAELVRQLARAGNAERALQALAGQSAAVVVDDLDAGLRVVDAWAAEHLEILTADASAVARRVKHAGAIFVGPYAPVSLGDYLAGSNHVLPTGGTARFTAGLATATFLRQVHLVEYDEPALAASAPMIRALAHSEQLWGHAEAVAVRLREPADDPTSADPS